MLVELTTLLEEFIKTKKETEKKLTEEFCLAMIQPDLPILPSIITRKRKAKELRRNNLWLGYDVIKEIASYLDWKDISKKSGFEINQKRKYKKSI